MSIDVNPLVHEVLLRARDLISTPEAWTKRSFARGKNGRPTAPSASISTQWCMTGAVQRSARAVTTRFDARWGVVVNEAIIALTEHPAIKKSIAFFNDHSNTTHDDVMRVFNETIDKLSSSMKAEVS